MTYCVGIKLKSGLIALSDTRISAGTAIMGAKKIHTKSGEGRALFLMVSGLRSVGDKVVTYFEEAYSKHEHEYDKMYKAVNLFGNQVKRAAEEDRKWLAQNGYKFDIHCIIGGQLAKDRSPKLFMVYPEGNWMEISDETPYAIIGNTKYGKAIMNMGLKVDSEAATALKLAYISFESTRVSCNDVGYPIDLLTYDNGSFAFREERFGAQELSVLQEKWHKAFHEAIIQLPEQWADDLLTLATDDTPVIPLEAPEQQEDSEVQAGDNASFLAQGGQLATDPEDQSV